MKKKLIILLSVLLIASLITGCAKTDDPESYSSHASVPYHLEDGRLTFEQGNVKCDAAMLTDPERIPLDADVYTVDRIRDIDLSIFLPADKNPVRECDESQYHFFDGYQELMNDHYIYYTDADSIIFNEMESYYNDGKDMHSIAESLTSRINLYLDENY